MARLNANQKSKFFCSKKKWGVLIKSHPSFFYLCFMDIMGTELGMLLNRSRTVGTEYLWRKVFGDKELQTIILDYIRWDQLYAEGVDEDNEVIGLYSDFTEWINPEKTAGTPYTLYDTGDFYDSMIIRVMGNAIEINADAIKTDESGETTDLFNEYGIGIVGLNEESKAKLIEELKERYNRELYRLLQGIR